MRALALMPLLWAGAWLGIDATGYWLEATTAFVFVTFFVIVFGIGECFHGPAHQALVGELGTERLRGRYFALHSMSWGSAARSALRSEASSSRRRRSRSGRSRPRCSSSRPRERSRSSGSCRRSCNASRAPNASRTSCTASSSPHPQV